MQALAKSVQLRLRHCAQEISITITHIVLMNGLAVVDGQLVRSRSINGPVFELLTGVSDRQRLGLDWLARVGGREAQHRRTCFVRRNPEQLALDEFVLVDLPGI